MCKTGCNNSISHYQRGYREALKDLEEMIDNSEHLDDSCLLEALYEALVNREVLR